MRGLWLAAVGTLVGCGTAAELASTDEAATGGAGTVTWKQQIGSGLTDGWIAVGPDDAVVHAGRVGDGWTYNQPSVGESIETDVQVIKYSSSGALVWARTYPGPDEEIVLGAGVDAAGDIILGGRGAADLGCEVAPPSGPFLVKLDGDTGACIWVRHPARVQAIDVWGSRVAVLGLDLAGVGGATVAVWDTAGGTQLWSRTVGGASVHAFTVAIGASAQVAVGGTLTAATDLGAGTLPRGAFVAAYQPGGAFRDATSFAGDGTIWSIDLDRLGETAFLGEFTGSIRLGAKSYSSGAHTDLFLGKLTTGLDLRWHRRPSGSATLYPSHVIIDPLGFVVASGTIYSGSFNVAPESRDAPAGESRLFVARFGANTGNLVWLLSDRGPAYYSNPTGLGSAQGSARIFLAGAFQGTMDLGDGAPLFADPSWDEQGFVAAIRR